MEKKIISNEIFWMCSENQIRWKDIKHIDFQDDDIIQCCHNEDDDLFYVSVSRYELETDEQFEERKRTYEKMREISKENRYQQYLKLKEEFDNQ
jgi:hypothetical protein